MSLHPSHALWRGVWNRWSHGVFGPISCEKLAQLLPGCLGGFSFAPGSANELHPRSPLSNDILPLAPERLRRHQAYWKRPSPKAPTTRKVRVHLYTAPSDQHGVVKARAFHCSLVQLLPLLLRITHTYTHLITDLDAASACPSRFEVACDVLSLNKLDSVVDDGRAHSVYEVCVFVCVCVWEGEGGGDLQDRPHFAW
jgi:hypothetical protein